MLFLLINNNNWSWSIGIFPINDCAVVSFHLLSRLRPIQYNAMQLLLFLPSFQSSEGHTCDRTSLALSNC